jgi:hypothetical protein
MCWFLVIMVGVLSALFVHLVYQVYIIPRYKEETWEYRNRLWNFYYDTSLTKVHNLANLVAVRDKVCDFLVKR